MRGRLGFCFLVSLCVFCVFGSSRGLSQTVPAQEPAWEPAWGPYVEFYMTQGYAEEKFPSCGASGSPEDASASESCLEEAENILSRFELDVGVSLRSGSWIQTAAFKSLLSFESESIESREKYQDRAWGGLYQLRPHLHEARHWGPILGFSFLYGDTNVKNPACQVMTSGRVCERETAPYYNDLDWARLELEGGLNVQTGPLRHALTLGLGRAGQRIQTPGTQEGSDTYDSVKRFIHYRLKPSFRQGRRFGWGADIVGGSLRTRELTLGCVDEICETAYRSKSSFYRVILQASWLVGRLEHTFSLGGENFRIRELEDDRMVTQQRALIIGYVLGTSF